MQLLLIRHALPEREENESGEPADPALSPIGRDQARRLARWLAPEELHAIYASPLRRALETARYVSEGRSLAIVREPGVIELDPEASSYIPLEELKETDYPAWQALVGGGLTAGTDIEAFRSTVVSTVERIIARHRGQRVAIVCHGGVINVWAAHVLGIDRPIFFEPIYTAVQRFAAAASGERSLLALNEAAHLRDLDPPT